MDKDKIKQGEKKIKSLEAGVHSNLKLIRTALNELCESQEIDTPESLIELNNIFGGTEK